jgi:hypothetical protein
MKERQEKIWNVLVLTDSETVLQTLTGYHGMQLLDEGFAEYLVNEGIMEPEEEEEEEGEEG